MGIAGFSTRRDVFEQVPPTARRDPFDFAQGRLCGLRNRKGEETQPPATLITFSNFSVILLQIHIFFLTLPYQCASVVSENWIRRRIGLYRLMRRQCF